LPHWTERQRSLWAQANLASIMASMPHKHNWTQKIKRKR